MSAEPWLPTRELSVPPEWIDYNGHMMDGYYLVAFSSLTDALLDHLDLGRAYRARTGFTIYTVEAHVSFQRELKLGQQLCMQARVLDADARRIHGFYTLRSAGSDTPAATAELLLLHIDQSGPRAAPMAPAHQARVEALRQAHARLPAPTGVGRSVSLRRPRA